MRPIADTVRRMAYATRSSLGKFSFHVCSPWSGDCAMGSIRLNIGLPGWFIIVALSSEGTVLGKDGRSHWIDIERK